MMPPFERSIGELFTDLTQNVRTLVRQEIALARAEITLNLSHLKRGAMFIGAGAILAFAGSLALVAGLCLALIALGMPAVAAPFVVGGVLLLLGLGLVTFGRNELTAHRLAPRATVEALKDNAQVVRGQLR